MTSGKACARVSSRAVTEPDTQLLIADRRQPDAEAEIRRVFTELIDASFGKWLASQERGRFLVVTLPALTMGDMFVSAATEDELVEVIGQKFLDHARAIGVSAPFHLHAWVEPPLLAKLRRMAEEIHALVEQRSATSGGDQPPPGSGPKLRVVK